MRAHNIVVDILILGVDNKLIDHEVHSAALKHLRLILRTVNKQ